MFNARNDDDQTECAAAESLAGKIRCGAIRPRRAELRPCRERIRRVLTREKFKKPHRDEPQRRERPVSSVHFNAIEPSLQFVPLATSDFDVKHQILDIQSQLRECLLDQRQHPPPSSHTVNDSTIDALHRLELRFWEVRDPSPQLDQFLRQILIRKGRSLCGHVVNDTMRTIAIK